MSGEFAERHAENLEQENKQLKAALEWLANQLQEIDEDASGGWYEIHTAEYWVEQAMKQAKTP
jgi:hypothetical protein